MFTQLLIAETASARGAPAAPRRPQRPGASPTSSLQVARSFRAARRHTLILMTFAGLLAFLGLAVVTMDVLGGVIATSVLLSGGRLRHLLAFAGGYAAVIVLATLVLHPLLSLLGDWLRPVLASNGAIGSVEVVVGAVLGGVALHQFRASRRPPGPPGRLQRRSAPRRLALWPMLLAGAAFSGTALADPAFPIAVGMASQVEHLPWRICLLVLWHLLYQAPLVTMMVIAATGRHDRLVHRLADWTAERRRVLQGTLAVVLVLLAAVVLTDGIWSLVGGHEPWLRQLLALR